MTQNILATDGLSPIGEDGKTIAFATPEGKAALHTYLRFFDEAGQKPIADKAARQEMFAGKLGLYFNFTAAVRSFSKEIGDRFAWDTAQMPKMTPYGGVASGGMAAVILTDYPQKRAAAFDYILYGTGPKAQAMIVQQTGYMPTNDKALDVLAPFYAKNQAFEKSAKQIGRAFPWLAWPGQNGVRISQIVLDEMTAIGNGQLSSDEAAEVMTDKIGPLLK